MLVLWLSMGLWHGSGWKFIIGEGLWFWIVIITGNMCGKSLQNLGKERIAEIFRQPDPQTFRSPQNNVHATRKIRIQLYGIEILWVYPVECERGAGMVRTGRRRRLRTYCGVSGGQLLYAAAPSLHRNV